MAGDAKAAAGLLDEIGPTIDTLVDDWCASWLGDADDSHWTSSSAAASGLDSREVCGLQAIAAAAANDQPAFVSAADRLGGFLVDSFSRDRAAWAKRLDRPAQQPDGELLAPLAALGEILEDVARSERPSYRSSCSRMSC